MVFDVALAFRLATDEQDKLQVFELLPLEDINPRELLPYITDDKHQLFEVLCKEYYDLKFPGKALVLLREAL